MSSASIGDRLFVTSGSDDGLRMWCRLNEDPKARSDDPFTSTVENLSFLCQSGCGKFHKGNPKLYAAAVERLAQPDSIEREHTVHDTENGAYFSVLKSGSALITCATYKGFEGKKAFESDIPLPAATKERSLARRILKR